MNSTQIQTWYGERGIDITDEEALAYAEVFIADVSTDEIEDLETGVRHPDDKEIPLNLFKPSSLQDVDDIYEEDYYDADSDDPSRWPF